MAENQVTLMQMTAQERLFCEEYVIDFIGIAAAQRAGVPVKTSPRWAEAMLKRKDIRDEIRRLSAQAVGTHNLGAEMVVGELGLIAFSNMDDYVRIDDEGDPHFDFSKVTRRQMAAVAELTVEEYMEGKGDDAKQVKRTRIRLHGKHDALVSLGKHFKIFNQDDPAFSVAIMLTKDEETA